MQILFFDLVQYSLKASTHYPWQFLRRCRHALLTTLVERVSFDLIKYPRSIVCKVQLRQHHTLSYYITDMPFDNLDEYSVFFKIEHSLRHSLKV